MGGTLLGILAKHGLAGKIAVCERDPSKVKRLKGSFSKVNFIHHISELNTEDVNVVLLAVKPQDFKTADLKVNKKTLVISIMAGVPIASIRRHTGAARIIRAMPNTPAQLGLGFTAWTATVATGRQEEIFAKRIFQTMGEELRVRSEDVINKFTAISGSGPAYFFYSALAFLDAARSLGIKQADAERAIRKTMEGAAGMLAGGDDMAVKMSQVASKGGTTEAALTAFKKSGFEVAWKHAVRAAYRRAKELEKMSGR